MEFLTSEEKTIKYWNDKGPFNEIEKYDIGSTPADAGKYKVVVVPTIIVFQDGDEVQRYQADLSFKMDTSREDVQDYIDELVMSAFQIIFIINKFH